MLYHYIKLSSQNATHNQRDTYDYECSCADRILSVGELLTYLLESANPDPDAPSTLHPTRSVKPRSRCTAHNMRCDQSASEINVELPDLSEHRSCFSPSQNCIHAPFCGQCLARALQILHACTESGL